MATTVPTRCRSCGRPIVWATTELGVSIPLIASRPDQLVPAHLDEALAAELELQTMTGAGRLQEVPAEWIPGDLFGNTPEGLVVEVLGNGQEADPDRPVWLSHFVDCPHAEEWRRP